MRAGRQVRLALILFVAAFAAFSPALQAGFSNFDDNVYVTENYRVQEGLTAQNVAWALTANHAANWHPLAWMSHMADVSMFGLKPFGHHLTSILFHAAAATVLLLFLARATGDVPKSFLVAGLFALHPLRVESVAWVAERKDVLSVFFGFCALWAYAGYARKPAAGRYLLVAGLLALSLMSKPMLVTAPFLLLLLDYWPLRRFGDAKQNRRLLLEKAPLLALAAAVSVLAFLAQQSGGAVGTFEEYSLGARVWNAAVAYWMYIWKTVWPAGLAPFYPHRGAETSAAAGIAALAGLGATTAAVVALRRRAPYLAVGWFWYLGLLVPVIGLVQIGEQAYADRYAYIPSVGLYVTAVWGVGALVERHAALKKAALALGCAVLVALAGATAVQASYWRDSETIWRRTIAVTRNNPLAYIKLANALQQQGRGDEAWDVLQKALQIAPDYSSVYNNLGSFKLAEGKPGEALPLLNKALQLRPQNTPAKVNLGIALLSLNRVEEGTRRLREVLQADPGNRQANYNLGVAALGAQRYGEALKCFETVMETDPSDISARLAYAVSLVHLGRAREAIPHLQEVARRDPSNPDAQNYLRQLQPQE